MQKAVLGNGLTILFEQKKGKSIVIEVMIKIGSNDEHPTERGIAHFLEHLLFEGTKKRPTNREISNEIEKIGGEFNAYTTNERTCFYVKILKKHFIKGVEVLSDVLQNPLFDLKHIEKEKNIVLKEIAMVNDEPRFYQWILLQKSLFLKHPCKNPTYGDVNIIKGLTKDKILKYFNKYYVPNNMVVSIVGDVDNWKEEMKKYFIAPKRMLPKEDVVKEPRAVKNNVKVEKRKITNTYVVLGFKTVPEGSQDSYVLEVINGILGRGQSGRMFTEIRSNRGLAYDVGTQNISEVTFGYFAIYATVDKKNVNLVKDLIVKELYRLKNVNELDLKEAKDFVEGDYLLDLDDGQKVADQVLFWEQLGDANKMKDFVPRIKKVTINDVKRVVNEYFNNYTMVVLEGK